MVANIEFCFLLSISGLPCSMQLGVTVMTQWNFLLTSVLMLKSVMAVG